MNSTRRRTLKPLFNYMEDTTEDEDENVDPKIKYAKLKLRQMMEDDSDQDPDFEKQLRKKDGHFATSSSSEDDDVHNKKGVADPNNLHQATEKRGVKRKSSGGKKKVSSSKKKSIKGCGVVLGESSDQNEEVKKGISMKQNIHGIQNITGAGGQTLSSSEGRAAVNTVKGEAVANIGGQIQFTGRGSAAAKGVSSQGMQVIDIMSHSLTSTGHGLVLKQPQLATPKRKTNEETIFNSRENGNPIVESTAIVETSVDSQANEETMVSNNEIDEIITMKVNVIEKDNDEPNFSISEAKGRNNEDEEANASNVENDDFHVLNNVDDQGSGMNVANEYNKDFNFVNEQIMGMKNMDGQTSHINKAKESFNDLRNVDGQTSDIKKREEDVKAVKNDEEKIIDVIDFVIKKANEQSMSNKFISQAVVQEQQNIKKEGSRKVCNTSTDIHKKENNKTNSEDVEIMKIVEIDDQSREDLIKKIHILENVLNETNSRLKEESRVRRELEVKNAAIVKLRLKEYSECNKKINEIKNRGQNLRNTLTAELSRTKNGLEQQKKINNKYEKRILDLSRTLYQEKNKVEILEESLQQERSKVKSLQGSLLALQQQTSKLKSVEQSLDDATSQIQTDIPQNICYTDDDATTQHNDDGDTAQNNPEKVFDTDTVSTHTGYPGVETDDSTAEHDDDTDSTCTGFTDEEATLTNGAKDKFDRFMEELEMESTESDLFYP